jgi:hypothetical protein
MTDIEPGPMDAMAWWDDLLEDAEARAEAYREDGWETLLLHTADVTPLAGNHDDRVGFSVLVPDDEFDELRSVFADTTVRRYDAYRTTVGGFVAFVLAIETGDDTAVLCPGYYETDDDSADALFEQAQSAGSLTVYLRRLDDTTVELSLAEPSLLAPPAEEERADGEQTPDEG